MEESNVMAPSIGLGLTALFAGGRARSPPSPWPTIAKAEVSFDEILSRRVATVFVPDLGGCQGVDDFHREPRRSNRCLSHRGYPFLYVVRRETVPMPTPCSRAMARMLLPAARAARIARTLVFVPRDGCRPPRRVPSAFAHASRAITRQVRCVRCICREAGSSMLAATLRSS